MLHRLNKLHEFVIDHKQPSDKTQGFVSRTSIPINILNSFKSAHLIAFIAGIILMFSPTYLFSQETIAEQLLHRQEASVDKSANNQNAKKSPTKETPKTQAVTCTGFTVTQTSAATNSLQSIIQSLVGSGVTVSNIQSNLPATSDIYGSFSCGGDVVGLEQGLVLTTGGLSNVLGPNASQSAGRNNGLPGNALLNAISPGGLDATVVSFNITPTGNTLSFNYVFASEEYNDYVGSTFNDVFGFFISGPGITGTRNIALLPNSNIPVAINNVNKGRQATSTQASNPSFFINNDTRNLPLIPQTPSTFRFQNLEYDGLTVPLAAVIQVVAGQTYTITFAIQDVSDGLYDSGVFIEGGSIQSTDYYYSKPTGDLHNVLSWGLNPDGSGETPPNFGLGKTFQLANRATTYSLTSDWTIAGRLNIPSASQLRIGSNTLSVADLIGSGSLGGTSQSSLIVTQPSAGNTSLSFATELNQLKDLTILSGATTSLTSSLNLFGVFKVQSGTFSTGNSLVLKSTVTSTASVAPVTGSITGTVTVERYIPARRAWRIMSAPVAGSQTINSAWQEGATTSSPNPNPAPGYGTHITEGNAALGFDHNPLTAMTSIKRYVSSSDSWVPLANTNATPVNSDAFLLFVRGERGLPLGENTVPPTITTLRSTGPLKTGDQSFPVSANGFTAIPNPFAAPINFATLTRTNVQNNFYLWDPKLGGEFGVGGYVLLSFNGTSYDIIPAAVSPESQYIQSGQGFLVHSTGTAGTITVKESDKSGTPATDVFRLNTGTVNTGSPFNTNISASTSGLRINLQSLGKDNKTAILDEVFSSYSSDYSDKIDNLDAEKMANVEENIAIIRDGHALMAERSKSLDATDLIQLKTWNLSSEKSYLLEFNPVSLGVGVSKAYLIDKYLKTTSEIDLSKASQVYFKVTTDASSVNPDRFSVVFKSPVENAADTKKGINMYPNPVTGKTLQLYFNDQPKGLYKIQLVNSLGQILYTTRINYAGGTSVQKIQLSNKPVTGIYILDITNGGVKTSSKVVIH